MRRAMILVVAGLSLGAGQSRIASAGGTVAVENQSSVTVPQTNLNLSCFFPTNPVVLGSVDPGQVDIGTRTDPVLVDQCIAALQYANNTYGPTCSVSTHSQPSPQDPPLIVITWSGYSADTLACGISFSGPGAPTGLTATTLGSAHLGLSWNSSGAEASSYNVYRSSGGGAFTKVGSTGGSTVTYDDLNLAAGTTYSYQVTAALGSFESPASSTASATTLTASGAPVAPGPLTVAAADDNSGAQVQLSWFDNSSDETSFHVERKLGSGSFSELVVLAADTSHYLDRAVAFSTTYTYRVRACNSLGCSAYSNQGTARP